MPPKLALRCCSRCGAPQGLTRYFYCDECQDKLRHDPTIQRPSHIMHEFSWAWWPSRGESWAAYERRIGEQPVDKFCVELGLA